MAAQTDLLEHVAISLWKSQYKGRFKRCPRRSWADLATVERECFRLSAKNVLTEAFDALQKPTSTMIAAVSESHGPSSFVSPVQIWETMLIASPLGRDLGRKDVMRKLTGRQFAVLAFLNERSHGATIKEIGGQIFGEKHRYLARAAARDVIRKLIREGLCEAIHIKPVAYRMTEYGRAVLATGTKPGGRFGL